jgi:gamma-glutamyltranspeptidase/glutathione hydrolase
VTPSRSGITQNWIVRKPELRTRGGVVVSQSLVAAEAGARILADGGNAIDAAVATGFALAAAEPWNSGLGGVGYMVVWVAQERRAYVVDFGPVSPARLDPADFPLAGGSGGDLFAWPAVVGERNALGPLSIAVPGEVDGLGVAHQRFGALPWAAVLQPAIELAERGLDVDWYTTLRAALWAPELARDRHSASIWLPDGFPAAAQAGAPARSLVIPKLAATLRRLADAGARDFYEGALADAIAVDLRTAGAVLDRGDLARYSARVAEPLAFGYRGAHLLAAGGLTACPTLAAAMATIGRRSFAGRTPGADAYVAYAEALSAAYAERFASLGDVDDARNPTSTTHLNVVDRDGNVVALTQTLLSVFGSKVTLPATGILMNNGVMWFDPRPGGPNAIGAGKRPLTNMCPVIAVRDGSPLLAVGASGGRRILPAVAQILSFVLDFGMDLPAAFHQPRIDASGEPAINVDPRLPEAVADALAQRFATRAAEYLVMPDNYARPCAILVDPATGERTGMTDAMSPWSGAAADDRQ